MEIISDECLSSADNRTYKYAMLTLVSNDYCSGSDTEHFRSNQYAPSNQICNMDVRKPSLYLGLWFILNHVAGTLEDTQYPNIVFILADDMGWNDVGFHGSNQIPTPNIDALAYSGVILNNYYTQPICTPSRSALMTGRHPIHNGMQVDVLYASQPWGLPIDQVILPQYLKRLGYVSRIVGKWHLGHFKQEYTPTFRGFDSHYGYWLGHQDHYTHSVKRWGSVGYDFRRNMDIVYEANNTYNTELFTRECEDIIKDHDTSRPLFLYLAPSATHAPLQAPEEQVNSFQHISKLKRRKFAAMMTVMDESVGRVVAALKNKGILDNTVIVFASDNGGATNGYDGNVASNWPLRGGKDTLWEGGVHAVGLVWSPLLKSTPRVHTALMHIQDWIPTLIAAANATHLFPELQDLDGKNQWPSLSENADAPYNTLLHNIDPVRNIGSLRKGDWKIVGGRTYNGAYDGWYGRIIDENPEYNLDALKESAVAMAIRNTTQRLPDDGAILRLRDDATMICALSRRVMRNKKKSSCQPHIAPCLFNIAEDPCEEHNVAEKHADVLADLVSTLKQMSHTAVKPNNKPGDRDSNPKYWNYIWTHWKDFPSPSRLHSRV